MPDSAVHITEVAREVLEVFSSVEVVARGHLARRHPGQLGDVWAYNNHNGVQSLAGIQNQVDEDYRTLIEEPALVRILALDDNGQEVTFFICRVTPVTLPGSKLKLASYRTALGKIASRNVGDDVVVGRRTYEIVEKVFFSPLKSAGTWDGINNIFVLDDGPHRSVPSLQQLVQWEPPKPSDDAFLNELLGTPEIPTNFVANARRQVVDRMALRDRPALDQFQDDIFREPLDEQMVISGPPGSGKTTTLIKRLGQKLDLSALKDSYEGDNSLVEQFTRETGKNYRESWIMFTPTDLLKQYLKEVFNKENIAAPDTRVRTWSHHRRELSRDQLPILRTGDRGFLLFDDRCGSLTNDALKDSPGWFDDIAAAHSEWVNHTLRAAAEHLALHSDPEAKSIGKNALQLLPRLTASSGPRSTVDASTVLALHQARTKCEELIKAEREAADRTIKEWILALLRQDSSALDDLVEQLRTIHDSASTEDGEDDGEDDEDENARFQPMGTQANAQALRNRAFQVANRALRSIARAKFGGRQVKSDSQAGLIRNWMRASPPSDAALVALGDRLLMVRQLRVLSRPVKLFLDRIPHMYAQVRRKRLAEKDHRWYPPTAAEAVRRNAVEGLEVDVMLLLMLTRARELEVRLTGTAASELNTSTHFELVRVVRDMRRAQVLVDEATDFSPVQLRCMMALSHPATRAFYASGDILQRVTKWGLRDLQQLQWVSGKLAVRNVSIAYRQTQQLNDFADKLAQIAGAPRAPVELPKGMDNNGVSPALGERLTDSTMIEWIASRVRELRERVGRCRTSIAVLVHDESQVQRIADGLSESLRVDNLEVVACLQGKTMGDGGDVRIFDVQHIKGLEFEAALFAGVDLLLANSPDLFDKLLYVGATRAATFLGIGCAHVLPRNLEPLRPHFCTDWK
jgi:hypothetical protein